MPRKGQKQTPEAIEKFRKARMGHIVTQETRDKISKSVKIRYENDKTYAIRISEKLKGKSFVTEEGRKRISESAKGRKIPDEAIERRAAKLRGRKRTIETRIKLSNSHKGQVSWIKGKHPSEESIRKNSEAHKGRQVGKDNPFFGKHHTEETKQKIRDANSGKKSGMWKNGASFEPYCELFNEAFKEYIRNKFNRRCFICNKEETDNVTKSGKLLKLSVHHVDYNKVDICNGRSWPFVPLCHSCHNKTGYHRYHWFNKLICYYVLNAEINFNSDFGIWCWK